MSVGVIYVATGRKYIDEALQSAASLKEQMPDLPITIYSSEEINSPYFEKNVLIESPKYGLDDKIPWMYKSPYERTLFIDTDTYICFHFLELFTLLDRFDIAVAHAPRRMIKKYPVYDSEVSESFPEPNTGVILFKKSPKVEQFFSEWYNLYYKYREVAVHQPCDQPAFRDALYKSDLRIATLTPEYNCRFEWPTFVSGKVKILHGRHPDLPEVASRINSKKGKRVLLRETRKGFMKKIPIRIVKKRHDILYW